MARKSSEPTRAGADAGAQLAFDWRQPTATPIETPAPATERTPDLAPERKLADRLRELGLRPVSRIVTHANRTVMVSLTPKLELRLHRGYAWAPDRVLAAIVRFLSPRLPRAVRRLAEREFLAFPVEHHVPPAAPRRRSPRPRPGDMAMLQRLGALHRELNARHFGGRLGEIPIRISGRMRTRLGELSVDLRTGRPIEIALSRRHIARHPWAEVEHTMLHEMVHQWQAESGLRVDHGAGFRRKAREVGVLPAARRPIRAAAARVDDAGTP